MKLSLRYALILALLAACSHETRRQNPLDAARTPPVALQAVLHDSTGAVELSWTKYAGTQPLVAYLVLRNVARSTDVDTLLELHVPDATTFTDTTLAPDTAYEYRVAVVSDGGFLQPSAVQRVDGFQTQAVQLQVPLADAVTGTIRLTWSRYRDPGFERYRLLRREVGTDVDTTLAQIAAVSDTTYVDADVLHGTEYIYQIVAGAAGQQQASSGQVARMVLPHPELLRVDLDSRTAAATLVWTPYEGPRFSRYEVVRLVEGEVPTVVATMDDINDTMAINTGLRGNTSYGYKIVVQTTTGELPESGHLQGTFHERVASWPLEVPSGATVRLHLEAGQLTALVASRGSIDLRKLSSTGRLEDSQLLYSNDFLVDVAPSILPAATAMAVWPDGSRHLLLAHADRVMLRAHDAAGAPAWRILLEERQTTDMHENGRYQVIASSSFFEELRIGGRHTYVDRIVGTSAGEPMLVEDFVDDDVEPLQVSHATFVSSVQAYPFYDQDVAVLIMNVVGDSEPGFAGDLGSVTDPGIEVDAALEASARLRLVMDPPAIAAVDMFRRTVEFFQPTMTVELPILPLQPFRLYLGYEGLDAVVRLEDPFVEVSERPVSGWASAVALDDLVLFTVDEATYVLRTDSGMPASEVAAFEATSDMMTWTQDRRTFIAMCLPESHRILTGRLSVSSFSGTVTLPMESAETTAILGNGFGRDDGELAFPLAYARGPEGRQYVLDAGNGRIQVFEEGGEYLTQWQDTGGGFDFGGGNVSTDFRGSIAVDDDGFIYVADVGNGRIQKFAP